MKKLLILIPFVLSSCGGFSGEFKVNLPEEFGGGTVPIVIKSEK